MELKNDHLYYERNINLKVSFICIIAVLSIFCVSCDHDEDTALVDVSSSSTTSSQESSSESSSLVESSSQVQSSSSEGSSSNVSSSAPTSSKPVTSSKPAASSKPTTVTSKPATSSAKPEIITPPTFGVNATENYKIAKKTNSDTVAWISIPKLPIELPVLQSSDNEYYLERDITKKYLWHGSVFMDCRNELREKPDSKYTNTVLYGHNKDDRTRFDLLLNYKRDSSLINESPYIYLETEKGQRIFRIFATFFTDTGFYYIETHPTEKDFNYIVSEARARSYYDIDCDVKYSDRLLTLSTCCYRYKTASGKSREDQRWVVMARELRDGESVNDSIPKSVFNSDYKHPNFTPLKYVP